MRPWELDLEIDDGFCADCNVPWEQCDCTFLAYVCGMGSDGYCSMAGTEDCDWECPRTRKLAPNTPASDRGE